MASRLTVIGLSILLAAAPVTAVDAAQGASARCNAPGVVGQTVRDARAAFLAAGCLQGSTRDGRHFVIKSACAPAGKVGLIVAQSKKGRLVKGDLVVLTKGNAKAADGQPCPGSAPTSGAAVLNGDYEGTLDLAGQPTRFTFAIKALTASGDVSGTLAWTQATSAATGTLHGVLHTFPCSGPVTFQVGTGGTVDVQSGEWSCDREGEGLPADVEIQKVGG